MNKLSACALLLIATPMALQAEEVDLDEIRAALDKYQDVSVALAEGYIPDPHGLCVTAEHAGAPAELGAMGIHYLNPELLGITSTDPIVDGTSTNTDWSRPSVLIYEPQADGSLELVAVENLVFIKAWEAAGNKQPPSFHGVPFERMVDDPATEIDEAHGFEPHYDRHVWLYRENPKGVFAPFNPAVSCKHHKPAAAAAAAHKH